MKKNTIRVDDIWNEKVPLKNIHVVEDTIIDIDDKLKKCEEALERAELGIGYDESLFKKFGDAIEDRNTVYNFTWQLTTWIHDNIDAPFKNDFDTYAWSPLSDIDYRKYEIDNDIGVTTKNSHPNAQGIIIEKKKLNLKDFLGSENEDKKSDSKNCEQVDDFAKIFKEQYKNLSKTMSEGDEKVKLPDMRKFWDPESKTADERFKEFLSMVADATIIVPIADAILGKDIITGEKLSAYGVTSKILIAVIDVITLGIGSLSNPAVSGVIKEYALGLGAATVSAAVYEVADASGLPPAVINALTIGAGIVTVIIGNKVLFKNKAGKVLATKDIDELKNPRVRGNETPPLRNEIDDYLDDVGDFYENDVFGHYYDEWPELDDYFDELARHSEDIDVGSVSKTSYGKSSGGLTYQSGSNAKLNELRNSLPDKYQVVDSYGNKIGNVAYSTSDIEGYSIEELKSFSKYGSKEKNGIKNPVDGWVSSVDNPAYSKDVLKINSDNEIDIINGYLRNNDTEYKIIEQYNQILGGNYEAKGKITIVSEREICPSCDNVIKAFSKDYANIEITLIDGAGKTYIVKNGVVQ